MPPKASAPPVPTTSEIPDTELLEAWVRHQRQQDFAELVRRHLGLVRGVARRQVGPDLADDATQMVFVILARKASGLTDLCSLGSWLHRVTMLQCKNMVRGKIRDRRNQRTAMENARLADGRDPLAETLPHLDAAICELSVSDRELIHLRYGEGLGFAEVALRTGRKEAALRQQASRALGKLGDLLKRRGVLVPAAALATLLGMSLTGKSSASSAAIISRAALASAATSGGSTFSLITLLIMSTKSYIVVGAALLALLAIWRVRDSQVTNASPRMASSKVTLSSASLAPVVESVPEKTKTDRSRAVLPPSPETLAAQEEMRAFRKAVMDNARIIGLGLFEFEKEYGAYPNAQTAARVMEATGAKVELRADTANDCFYQLLAANIMMGTDLFSVDKPGQGGKPPGAKQENGLGKCDFSYLAGMNATGNPSRPLAVFPLVNGKTVFDPEVLGGKAVVLRVDNSVSSYPIEQDGTVLVGGMDMFDPEHPLWKGGAPTVKWPAK